MWHIGRVLAFGGLLAVLASFATPPEVDAAKKKKDAKAVADNGNGATPADYQAIQNRKELTGTIVSASGKVVTLKVDTPRTEANPNYKPPTAAQLKSNPQLNSQYKLFQESQRLQRDLVSAQNAKTPQARAQAMQRYYMEMSRYQMQTQQQQAQLMARAAKDPNYAKNNANNTTDPLILVHSYKEYDLETTDTVSIRKMFLPFEYDDMGAVKKYTAEEKAELRGEDRTKPGYKSKMEEIAAGMEAKLTLVAPPKKKKDPDAKPDEEGIANVDRPTVSAILLTKDNPTATTIEAADPKKKKKDAK